MTSVDRRWVLRLTFRFPVWIGGRSEYEQRVHRQQRGEDEPSKEDTRRFES
jgi:hypothetical protein